MENQDLHFIALLVFNDVIVENSTSYASVRALAVQFPHAVSER